ncbi:MAG: hypothetical protein J2P18_14850 [Nocardia sp.]|nr:hypothetical protein [Nocardia sp.]
MRANPRIAAGLIAAAVVAVVVLVLGARPPVAPPITTDELGPDSGDRVPDYLARTGATLTGDQHRPRWALVTLKQGIAAADVPEYAGGLRVSQVLLHVPIDRVYTPVITVPVPDHPGAVRAAQDAAAGAMAAQKTEDDRSRRIAAVVASRLRSGCDCVVNLVVRGDLGGLRALAAHSGVRSVEALPPDASAGAFAVRPLLPEQTDLVGPGSHDGVVPDR